MNALEMPHCPTCGAAGLKRQSNVVATLPGSNGHKRYVCGECGWLGRLHRAQDAADDHETAAAPAAIPEPAPSRHHGRRRSHSNRSGTKALHQRVLGAISVTAVVLSVLTLGLLVLRGCEERRDVRTENTRHSDTYIEHTY